jgi:hypothetical protein
LSLFRSAFKTIGEPKPLKFGTFLKIFRSGPISRRFQAQTNAAKERTLATSRGTKDCVRQALAAGIPTYLIDGDDAAPKRITVSDWRLASWV